MHGQKLCAGHGLARFTASRYFTLFFNIFIYISVINLRITVSIIKNIWRGLKTSLFQAAKARAAIYQFYESSIIRLRLRNAFNLRACVHAAGLLAGTDAGSLLHLRLRYKYYYAAHVKICRNSGIRAKKHGKNAGTGTLIATILPHSMTFLVSWSILLVIWTLFGLFEDPQLQLAAG